ncbi:MAG: VOC family protein [Gammaproteobacteria bacterium]|nr:VOC family protein [Gammaproteobacteria bacterium]
MKLNQPVPELPVADVEKAQRYYCDVLGCKIEWIYPGKEIGAVSNDETAIFLRKRTDSFELAVHWIYADDVDAIYKELVEAGANIVDDIENKPWGLRQFTIKDLDSNVFYIHHDLPEYQPGQKAPSHVAQMK